MDTTENRANNLCISAAIEWHIKLQIKSSGHLSNYLFIVNHIIVFLHSSQCSSFAIMFVLCVTLITFFIFSFSISAKIKQTQRINSIFPKWKMIWRTTSADLERTWMLFHKPKFLMNFDLSKENICCDCVYLFFDCDEKLLVYFCYTYEYIYIWYTQMSIICLNLWL